MDSYNSALAAVSAINETLFLYPSTHNHELATKLGSLTADIHALEGYAYLSKMMGAEGVILFMLLATIFSLFGCLIYRLGLAMVGWEVLYLPLRGGGWNKVIKAAIEKEGHAQSGDKGLIHQANSKVTGSKETDTLVLPSPTRERQSEAAMAKEQDELAFYDDDGEEVVILSTHKPQRTDA